MKHATLAAAILAGIGAVVPAADPPASPASKSQPAANEPADIAHADDRPAAKKPVCRVCGGTCHLAPVCVCEPATKKKTAISYSMKCEPVCVPEPCLVHRAPGRHHAASCTGIPCDGSCGAATVRTKKLLLKTVTEEEVDVIERKVEYLCRHCAGVEAAATCCSCGTPGTASAPRPWWKSLWAW